MQWTTGSKISVETYDGFLDGLDTGASGVVEGENNGVISYL